METTGSLKANAGIVGEGGLEVKIAKNSSFVRGARMRIQGFIGPSSSKHPKENYARWDLAENTLQKAGIPHDFCCGVIVAYTGERFEADVKFEFSVALAGGWTFGGWPWNADDPLVFNMKDLNPVYLDEVRKSLKDRDLKDLTQVDFQKLAPLANEYHVTFPFFVLVYSCVLGSCWHRIYTSTKICVDSKPLNSNNKMIIICGLRHFNSITKGGLLLYGRSFSLVSIGAEAPVCA